jgi:hypothetical protein
VPRPRLLLYLDHARSPRRAAVAATLAALADRAGVGFECYYDDFRAGRHFGGGDPAAARPGWPAGSTVAGGRHADHLLRLAAAYDVAALGDPDCVLWPALQAARVEVLERSADPAALYATAFEHLGQPVPPRALVLDGQPQGAGALVAGPYLYPTLLAGDPVVAVDASADAELRAALEALGVTRFEGLYVDPARAAAFPGGLDGGEGEVEGHTYASLTRELAERHAAWGRGVLIGDPDLVAAQLPRARRLALLPLYGRPQTEAIEAAEELIRRAREPVFGRQYDDRDFFELARLGHGLQVVDPDPPFDALGAAPAAVPAERGRPGAPDDSQLERWADEGRVLVTLLFWCGMLRELHCLPPLLDLVAITGLRGGLVVTDQTIEHGASAGLSLLADPVERGGVLGRLDLLLGSTGSAVAAETLMPPGALRELLAAARSRAAERLPEGLVPQGWWPLLDTELVGHRQLPVTWRDGRPVVPFTPRPAAVEGADADGANVAPAPARGRRLRPRSLAGAAVRGLRLDWLFEERRPFEHVRPGRLDAAVAVAVADAGFSYMWTKAGFGTPRIVARDGAFVALSLTAGRWDGWSPFYTVRSASDLARAERRLTRSSRPGWLVATVDSPLWALPGELWQHGGALYRMAELAARGGASGRLVNTTPDVVARYARVLDARGALPAGA